MSEEAVGVSMEDKGGEGEDSGDSLSINKISSRIDGTKSGEEGDDESDSQKTRRMTGVKKKYMMNTKKDKICTDSDDEDSEAEPSSPMLSESATGWLGSLLSQASNTISSLSGSMVGGLSTVMDKVDQHLGIPDPAKLAERDLEQEKKRKASGEAEITTGIEAVLESVGIIDGGCSSEDDPSVINRLAEEVKGEESDGEIHRSKPSWLDDVSSITSKLMYMNVFGKMTDVLNVTKGKETIREIAGRLRESAEVSTVEEARKEQKKRYAENSREVFKTFLERFDDDDWPTRPASEVESPKQIEEKLLIYRSIISKGGGGSVEIILEKYKSLLLDLTSELKSCLFDNDEINSKPDSARDIIWKCCFQVSELTRETASSIQKMFENADTEVRGSSLGKTVNNVYLRESEFYGRIQNLIETIVD